MISSAGIGALIGGPSDADAEAASSSTSGASSSAVEQPKAKDISHLIKRKKTETAAEEGAAMSVDSTDAAPPAKKAAP